MLVSSSAWLWIEYIHVSISRNCLVMETFMIRSSWLYLPVLQRKSLRRLLLSGAEMKDPSSKFAFHEYHLYIFDPSSFPISTLLDLKNKIKLRCTVVGRLTDFYVTTSQCFDTANQKSFIDIKIYHKSDMIADNPSKESFTKAIGLLSLLKFWK